MANITQGNQIRKGIGLFISFYSKDAKRNNVMNIKSFTQLNFRRSALSAFIAVAVSGIAPLLSPVSAVIRQIATSPIGSIFASFILRNEDPKAFQRTKVMLCRLDLARKFGKLFSANFARHKFWSFAFYKLAKIDDGIRGSGALMRTKLSRPTSVIPEFFAALGAICKDACVFALARARTVTLYPVPVARRIVRKFFLTSGASRGFLVRIFHLAFMRAMDFWFSSTGTKKIREFLFAYWTDGGFHMFTLLVVSVIVSQRREVCYGRSPA